VAQTSKEEVSLQQKIEWLSQFFDKDRDGKLNAAEQAAMKEFADEYRKKIAEPADSYAKGPYAIEAIPLYVLKTDSKELQLRITYPVAAGTYPLILFSHGLFGTKDSYSPLIQFWASYGYVIIQTNHEDSLALGLQKIEDALKAWDSRPKDMSLILDCLDQLEKQFPQLQNKIDKTKIAAAGHSFGAHTSQLLAGTKCYVGWFRSKDFRDQRITSALFISPQGVGVLFKEKSFSFVQIPAMIITGSQDTSPINGKGPDWRKEAYTYSSPGDKYFVFIQNAHHGFGGITGKIPFPGSGAMDPQQVWYVQEAGLQFFDAYLKGIASKKQSLQQHQLETISNGEVKLDNK